MTRYEIPRETINALRRQAADQAKYKPLPSEQFGGQSAFLGTPVIEEDGKFYIDVKPTGMSYTQAQQYEQLVIQQVVERSEVGAWISGGAEIKVWDGEAWLVVPDSVLVETDAVYAMVRDKPFSAELVSAIKLALEEREEEAERLSLRQLLAESQGEDEGDDEG